MKKSWLLPHHTPEPQGPVPACIPASYASSVCGAKG
eukprot:CAMPEP_0117528024 /NCGR_PEP_ID=MMETSP0784-20121206/37101_1 /TAXON_ID=39447 /ORGANISM="" /LENGTH=35 /DNA_ID= /DNA_START= /DNA_END= /DNA_ORIENTATION=